MMMLFHYADCRRCWAEVHCCTMGQDTRFYYRIYYCLDLEITKNFWVFEHKAVVEDPSMVLLRTVSKSFFLSHPCCKTTKKPEKGRRPPRLSSHHNQKEQGLLVTYAIGHLDDLNYCMR